MQTIFLLTKVGSGRDQKTYFNRQGVAFNPNRDGSINFKLDMFPSLTFQMRENPEEPHTDNSPEYNQAVR